MEEKESDRKMTVAEMVKKSIEDSVRWKAKPGSETRRAIRPFDRGGSPESGYRREDTPGAPEAPSRGRTGAMVRVIGFLPHLQGKVVAG